MRLLLTFVLVFFLTLIAQAQSPKDSLLLNERSIDRPVNLHGGQLRIELGYSLSSVTKRYDANGEVVKLSEDGISYVQHAIPIGLRFGILEHLEIELSSTYRSEAQRAQEVLVVGGNVFTNLFQVTETRGFEDLSIDLTGRIPLRTRKIDILLHAGTTIPVGSGKSKTPEHTITEELVSPSILRYVVYTFRPVWGNGVLVGNAGGTIKLRGAQYAFTISANYAHALKESENNQWQFQLNEDEFEYQSETYRYLIPDRFSYWAEIERQLAPWFVCSLQLYGEQLSGGWNEQNNANVSRDASSWMTLSPGYEILITPKIWLRQRLQFSVAGKNADAPFIFTTGLIYNFFPFD